MSKPTPPAVLAKPYTQRQLDRFEQLIIRCHSSDSRQARAAKAALRTFTGMLGQSCCDMMMEALTKKHAALAERSNGQGRV